MSYTTIPNKIKSNEKAKLIYTNINLQQTSGDSYALIRWNNIVSNDYVGTPVLGSIFFDGSGILNNSFGLLTFDNSQNLYVSNYYNNTIAKITPSGVGSIFLIVPILEF